MDEAAARRRLADAATLVVKVGTNALSRPDDTLDVDRVRALAGELSDLRVGGRRVVLVSSGAVGAGIGLLGLSSRPADLPRLQAAAAAGQAKLIGLYDEALNARGLHAAQLLLTGNDFKQRKRYLNVRHTLSALLSMDVVPVVNENDTVSVDEIRFGDNDRLAALVAGLFDDAALVILTAVEGLMSGTDAGAERVRFVASPDDPAMGFARDDRSSLGSGGMAAKLRAVRSAVEAGVPVAIADGRTPGKTGRLIAGEDVGTAFAPAAVAMPAWKRWLAHAAATGGELFLDAGAVWAVVDGGRSLLPVGVTRVRGDFDRGDIVVLRDPDCREVARGLTNYAAADAARLAAGDAIERPYESLVHRNNLVVVSR